MINTSNTHFPATDDITCDSLEYLFKPAPACRKDPIPWVEIESGSILKEFQTIDTNARVEVLQEQLEESLQRVQNLSVLVGYLQGIIRSKNEQLKALPDLRLQAGMSVAHRLEAERCKEKIQELEAVIKCLKESCWAKTEQMLSALRRNSSTDEFAISILSWLGLTGLSGILFTIVQGF